MSVSIVIPVFNGAAYLKACVASCRDQGAADIVVVDDGSTDETATLAEALGVRLIRKENGGVGSARNVGAAETASDWLMFLDVDDMLVPRAVSTLLEQAEAARAGVVYGMVIERRAPGELARLNGFAFCSGEPPRPAQANLDRCAIITPGSALVRREVFLEAGGFVTGTEPMEDRDFWLRCGLLTRFAHADSVVLDKTWRPGSHGSQAAKRIYRGWLAKRRLRMWGDDRGRDVRWIPDDRILVTQAIKEAFHEQRWELLVPLLRDVEAVGARNYWTVRARLTSLVIKRPPPVWIDASAGLPLND
ncbi:MAG: glycosyltransferase family A protein [Terrimicrobiaceae bacterium]|nr:glycosyltransferase family A protein [Terrimicrobiaceae bacterium]